MSEPQRKPIPRAVAIRHEKGTLNPPEMVASGAGEIAQKIIDLAKTYGIPIHPDPDLVRVLSHLDIGERIPPELYRAVAEILCFIYRVNSQHTAKSNSPR